MTYAEAILLALEQSGRSAREVSLAAVGHESAIRSLKRGLDLRGSTIEALCRELDLDFHIGLQHHEPPSASPAEAALDPAGFASDFKEAVREELGALRTETQAMRRAIRKEIREDLAALPRLLPTVAKNDLEDIGALAVATVGDGATGAPAARLVQMIEMEAAAGGGAYNLDEAPVAGPVWFRRDWIDSRGIDPMQAVIISVRGDSMEPTLPAGCKILVDRHRRRRHVGHIYVITMPDGLVVKRMGRGEDGGWLLVSDSDSPDWPDMPWPDDAVVAGEVKWMARELP